MNVRLEQPNPGKDLGGLCECFVYEGKESQTVAALHMHEYFELLYCLSGSFSLTAQQQEFSLKPGSVALLRPMTPHSTLSLEEDGNSYLVLKFMPDALYDTRKQLYGMKYLFPYIHFSDECAFVYTARELEGSQMGELLNRILQEREQKAYGYEIALHAYISQVLLWFLRMWNHKHSTEMDERAIARLQQAQSYIETHMDSELKAEDVANHLHMGLSTFSRFFAQMAGMSFPAYVRGKRLGRAAILLAQSRLTITQIALETGFSSTSYLILCFRRQYGVTPVQFRRLSSFE